MDQIELAKQDLLGANSMPDLLAAGWDAFELVMAVAIAAADRSEQLGSDKIDVRIGGIYALEHIARDSKRDHPTVMEVLTASVRVHSREQSPLPGPGHANHPRSTPADVQAALTVIGRRLPWRDIQGRPIDLTRALLPGADLAGADLARANLTGADLTDAILTDTDLSGAILTSAKWPKGTPIPEGWECDASGLLTAASPSPAVS